MKKKIPARPVVEMFSDASDLPLFSGTPISVVGSHFSPCVIAAERQDILPGFEEAPSQPGVGQVAVQAAKNMPKKVERR